MCRQSKLIIKKATAEEEQPESEQFGSMIGSTKIMQQTFGRLKMFACHDFPVLITVRVVREKSWRPKDCMIIHFGPRDLLWRLTALRFRKV